MNITNLLAQIELLENDIEELETELSYMGMGSEDLESSELIEDIIADKNEELEELHRQLCIHESNYLTYEFYKDLI